MTESAKSAHVNAIIDQMATVADHYMSAQTERAKRLLLHCTHEGHTVGSDYVEDMWVGWNEGLSDLTQACFTWVQLFDALAEDCWGGSKSKQAPPTTVEGVFVKNVRTAPQPVTTAITSTDLTSVDGDPIASQYVRLEPDTLPPGVETMVKVTVTPPKTTPTNVYHGSINGSAGQTIAEVEILILGP